MTLQVRIVGSGDAFGSGGRFNTCIHVRGERVNFLIDCGASSMIGLKQVGIDPNTIETILITHFHADHFGGIPFFMLDSQYACKRRTALTIVGPPGLPDWYKRVMETAFAGSSATELRFPLTLREFEPGTACDVGSLRVTPFHVLHDDRAGPCLALRVEAEGKVIAFSGDTEWTDRLVEAGKNADLFICECYSPQKAVKLHMALPILEQHLPRIAPKRLLLTHMSEDMLAARVGHPTAKDGMVIEL